MAKNLTLTGLIVLLAFILNACMLPLMMNWKLYNQPNTKWVSDDETIVIYVDDNSTATGTMNVNGQFIEFYLTEGPQRSTEMHVFPKNVLQNEVISHEDEYEFWVCKFKSEEEFVVTVKKTTFFEVGETIAFFRADEQQDTQ